jgi:hypothetical protein
VTRLAISVADKSASDMAEAVLGARTTQQLGDVKLVSTLVPLCKAG